MALQAAALSSPSLPHPLTPCMPFIFLCFSSPLSCNSFYIHLSLYFKDRTNDLTQDDKRLEKNHRLLSIYFYFNFPLHFSRPKSFWPTLSLYSSLYLSVKTVKSSVNYLPPPPPPGKHTSRCHITFFIYQIGE